MPLTDEASAPTARFFIAAGITVVVAAVVAVELGLLILALGGTTPVLQLLCSHAAVAVLLLSVSCLAYCNGVRSPFLYLFAVTVPALGPVGVLGSAILASMERFYGVRSIPFQRWHAEFFAEPVNDSVNEVDDKIARSGDPSCGNGTVTSIADIMSAGTIQQKQSALGLVADHFHPAYATALRRALNDPEAVVRVQAASVAARLDDDFQKRGARLRRHLENDPQDRQAQAELAKFCLDYSDAGLSDDMATAALRKEALNFYENLSRRFPHDVRYIAACAKLLLETGRARGVAELLQRYVGRDNADPDIFETYLAALMQERRFKELRLIARRCTRPALLSDPREERVSEMIAFWGACDSPKGTSR